MSFYKIVFIGILSISAYGSNFISQNVKKMNWNGIDVVWIKDTSLPTYEVMIYFQEGALGDTKGKQGQTQFMFNELSSGTSRYAQAEILGALEFYGTSFGANVTHEFSTYTVSGLTKDLIPSFKMVCHMFDKATFPKRELSKSKRRAISGLKSMITNHGALASRAFRELSLGATEFSYPVSGKVSSISKISSKDLLNRLNFFNKKTHKRIYVKGPKEVLALKPIIEKDCHWGKVESRPSTFLVKQQIEKQEVILVPVKKANQAQIRIGNVLTHDQSVKDQTRLSFASKFIGGGFTSRLMQEVRVKRGLTYSIGAFASGQRDYGRSGISTFTESSKLIETLKVIRNTIRKSSDSISKEEFEHSKRFIKGNYLLSLESSTDFMNTLLYLDHQGRSYDELYNFPKEMDKVNEKALREKISEIFGFNKQMIVILGEKKLRNSLKKAGYKVKVVDYKKFL